MYLDFPFDFDFLSNFYSFNRPIKDMYPYRIVKKDDKIIIVLNTLGVSEEDINVDIEAGDIPNRQILKVGGKTHDEIADMDYDINMKFAISKEIDKIDWGNLNGVTYLYIYFKEPTKPNVKINKL
jgi:HSP20 family molecular chaperone IbpA